eukprot:5533690-Amphidinium_carterae.1
MFVLWSAQTRFSAGRQPVHLVTLFDRCEWVRSCSGVVGDSLAKQRGIVHFASHVASSILIHAQENPFLAWVVEYVKRLETGVYTMRALRPEKAPATTGLLECLLDRARARVVQGITLQQAHHCAKKETRLGQLVVQLANDRVFLSWARIKSDFESAVDQSLNVMLQSEIYSVRRGRL